MFDKTTVRGLLAVALALAGVFLAVSNAWAGEIGMTLPGTGFDTSGNALGNYGIDGSWTVSGSQYGGSAAYVIMPGDPDWYSYNWSANTASNGWSGSSWINDNNQYDGGGSTVPYTYSMSFSLAGLELNNDLQLSGSWGIDDAGTLAINGHTIATCVWDAGHTPVGYSLSYAANPTWFNAGANTISITMTSTDNYCEAVRFQGVVTGNAVPEPSTFALLATGAIGLLGYASRRRRQTT